MCLAAKWRQLASCCCQLKIQIQLRPGCVIRNASANLIGTTGITWQPDYITEYWRTGMGGGGGGSQSGCHLLAMIVD